MARIRQIFTSAGRSLSPFPKPSSPSVPGVLIGSVQGAGRVSGRLTVGAPPLALAGSIPASGVLAGSLTITAASGLVQARKGRLVAALAA